MESRSQRPPRLYERTPRGGTAPLRNHDLEGACIGRRGQGLKWTPGEPHRTQGQRVRRTVR